MVLENSIYCSKKLLKLISVEIKNIIKKEDAKIEPKNKLTNIALNSFFLRNIKLKMSIPIEITP